jgi:MinD-like ATPase involved in chromosome partitioning or flagellar assembly
MPITYEPIATNTLGSNTTTITFSSISGSYTDLVLVCQIQRSTATGTYLAMQFNSDTGSNYSSTFLGGDGTTAASARYSNRTDINLDYYASPQNNSWTIRNISINNYSNTTTYKTVLNRANDASKGTDAGVHLWRSTAAISTITLTMPSNDFITGSTFTLYGIKAA